MIALLMFGINFMQSTEATRFPCQHGPQCGLHTITFDTTGFPVIIWWLANAVGGPWQETFDTCTASPCEIEIRHPSSGNCIYLMAVAP